MFTRHSYISRGVKCVTCWHLIILKTLRVLLTSALRTLFKVFLLRNYSLKKFNTSIFDALNAQFFIKIYYLKFLKSALKTLVNIFQSIEYIS